MTTYQNLLDFANQRLSSITEESSLEAEILLLECFNLSKSQFILCKSDVIQDECRIDQFHHLVSERETGRPLAYVLGHWYFLGSKYVIEPGILVPRPETELLVEEAIKQLEILSKQYHYNEISVLELGFGSGIITIECAKRFPNISFRAWDISDVAYRVAIKNADRFSCSNIMWKQGDFFDDADVWEPLIHADKPTLLLSNPPYIPSKDIEQLDAVVKDFEPREALDGGDLGMDIIEKLINVSHLGRQIIFIGEIGFDQRQYIQKNIITI